MKRLILIILASSGLVGAQARSIFSDPLGGAPMGAAIGGTTSGNCHHEPLN
jgi:hypothetical protein